MVTWTDLLCVTGHTFPALQQGGICAQRSLCKKRLPVIYACPGQIQLTIVGYLCNSFPSTTLPNKKIKNKNNNKRNNQQQQINNRNSMFTQWEKKLLYLPFTCNRLTSVLQNQQEKKADAVNMTWNCMAVKHKEAKKEKERKLEWNMVKRQEWTRAV